VRFRDYRSWLMTTWGKQRTIIGMSASQPLLRIMTLRSERIAADEDT
jgi:hypothetical protein